MVTDAAVELVNEWGNRAGDDFKPHFRQAHDYFKQAVSELASDDAAWTVSDHEGHAVLLLASETAFALVAFSGPADGVRITGLLHPLDEGVIRVSFNDELATDAVQVGGMEPFTPMVRRWSFDWHGRLQLPIEYWLTQLAWVPTLDKSALQHNERQRAMAHKLARAAGWPISGDDAA